MKQIIVAVFIALLMSACSSLKVNVDYDPEFDFTSKKTFAIVHYNKEGEDTLFNDRLINALEQELFSKNYIKKEKGEAELIFVFHVNVEHKTDIHTDYVRLGYSRYHYAGQMMATTRTYKYKKGTLVIDVLNPKDDKIVFRSIATDILKTHDTPQKRTEYLNNVIKEAMKDFPPKVQAK